MRSLPGYGLRARCRLKRNRPRTRMREASVIRRQMAALESAYPPFPLSHTAIRQMRPCTTLLCSRNSLGRVCAAPTAASHDFADRGNLRCSWGFLRTHRQPQHGTKARPLNTVLSIRFFTGTWVNSTVRPEFDGGAPQRRDPSPILTREDDRSPGCEGEDEPGEGGRARGVQTGGRFVE